MISQAGRWTQTPSATPLQPRKWNAHFCITFNFWCWPGWSMDSNPIHHPSPPQKMKCPFLDYVQLLIIGRAGRWTWAPSTTPLQPKKWNAHFCITFNIWCWPDWSMDLNLIHHSTPANNMKCSFLGHIQLLMISQAVRWTKTPSATPLQPIKWNAHFWITFTSDDLPGWLMNLNLICHPSPTKKMKCSILYYIQHLMLARLVNGLESHPPPVSSQKMKCSFLGYVQLLMISQAVWWTQTPSATPLQPIKWNAYFALRSISDNQPGWSMDSNPICHPSPAKKWNAHFCIMFKFWWLAGLVEGLKPHPPPLSTPKNEMLIFGLRSTSDDWPGWSMDWNPLCHPSSQKNEMLIFGLRSTSDDRLGGSIDSNPILHLSPAKEMKCSFLYYVQLLMIGWAGRWTWTPSTTPLKPKMWNAHFCITFNIWCWPDWSMDLNLIHHSSPAKNMKCSFLGYIQLLMISHAVRWTQTPSTTLLQPIKWNAHFWITLNFWWSAGLVNGLEPHPPPVFSIKN